MFQGFRIFPFFATGLRMRVELTRNRIRPSRKLDPNPDPTPKKHFGSSLQFEIKPGSDQIKFSLNRFLLQVRFQVDFEPFLEMQIRIQSKHPDSARSGSDIFSKYRSASNQNTKIRPGPDPQLFLEIQIRIRPKHPDSARSGSDLFSEYRSASNQNTQIRIRNLSPHTGNKWCQLLCIFFWREKIKK